MIRGAALARQGRHDEGLAELRRGMGAHDDMEAAAYQPFAMALIAEGSIAAGNADEALATLDRAVAVSDATGERFYAAELQRLRAEALQAAGRHDDAARALQAAIDVAQRQGARLFGDRARALAARWGTGRAAAPPQERAPRAGGEVPPAAP
jgi:tetratricopeptide (TPR) repeat protein